MEHNGIVNFESCNNINQAGGNLGILWPLIEKMNRAIIIQNPDSKIYVFPNSIFYGNVTMHEKSLKLQKKYITAIGTYIYVQEKEFHTIL